MTKRVGKQTIILENKPRIIATTSVVGPKEGDGPLKDYFDVILSDDLNGKDSFEKAESSIMYRAVQETLKKVNLQRKRYTLFNSWRFIESNSGIKFCS